MKSIKMRVSSTLRYKDKPYLAIMKNIKFATLHTSIFISRPELKIRRVWSAYLAAAAVPAAVPRLRLKISVDIDPRFSKLKSWNLWKKSIFLLFFPPRSIRLIVLIVN